MSSTTPLLRPTAASADHSIFLRSCHSPWSGITQPALAAVRFIIALYLLITFVLVYCWEYKIEGTYKYFWFKYSTINLFLQLIYHWVTFVS
jgi:hypothetical protein